MLTGLLIVNCILAAAFILAGSLAILKDSKALLNQLFFSFTLTIAIWLIANHFSNVFTISYNQAIWANHLTLFTPGVVLLLLLNFAILLTNGNPFHGKWVATNLISLLVISTSLSDLVIQEIHRQGEVYAITFGPFVAPYFLTLVINMALIVYVLIRGRRKSHGQQHERINALLLGVSALLLVNLATNAVLPALGAFALTNIGPLSAVFVVYALWYSIVKQRLFDIRMVIARSLAYVLSLGTMAAVFFIIAYSISDLLFNDDVAVRTLQIMYTVLAVGIAFVSPSFKRFFDKHTNQWFYRDSYDSQSFLDKFNKVLVSNYELNLMLKQAAKVIATELKLEYCLFVVKQHDGKGMRIIGTPPHPKLSHSDILSLHKTSMQSGQIIKQLDVTDTAAHSRTSSKGQGIALMVRLASSARDEGVGYVFMGNKKSGNVFSHQDVSVTEILANELYIGVQNALRTEQIENFNITLQAKVDEATRKLRRTNEKLKALDEAKDDFVSMASHQLRTPLTSIKGYTSMVLEGDAGKINATQRQLLEQSFASSQRMVYLIADLLNVSRLKTGKFIIEPTSVNLAEVVQQEIGQLKEAAAGRSLELTYDMPQDFPTLMLDETKTRQIIMNFVDNAIYYTPAGGHIKVQLRETPTSVEFRVIDDGIGVPKSEQPHLFTKFYRAGNARTARPDGTGLGLFMAKKVIVAQGGAIIFETEEGKGSTFGFIFSKTPSN